MLKNTKNNLNGWLVIDKPLEWGSTDVVTKLKHLLSPEKIGHAGTLDPLATGVLPIAFGHATKLIPYVMDGRKIYDFQITWGSETETDDGAGTVTATSGKQPTEQEVKEILPTFIGTIEQVPPAYSAIKIAGKRAYDLARSGAEVTLKARPVHIEDLALLRFGSDMADFRVVCGKGTYVRSLARDIGRKLGCLGHITALRRVACGPFRIEDAHTIDSLNLEEMKIPLLPMDTTLTHLPALVIPENLAKRLRQGQRLPLRDVRSFLAAEIAEESILRLITDKALIGLVRYSKGVIHPYRIFPE